MKKTYSFLLESLNFDLNHLDNLSNIDDRIKYCDDTLEFIGKGIGKRVYKLNNESVSQYSVSLKLLI